MKLMIRATQIIALVLGSAFAQVLQSADTERREPSSTNEEKIPLEKAATNYLHELDDLLVRKIREFVKLGDAANPFPSGVEYILKVSSDDGDPPPNVKKPRFYSTFFHVDRKTAFDWAPYTHVEVWIRPLTGFEPDDNLFVEIGWKKTGGVEFLEGVEVYGFGY